MLLLLVLLMHCSCYFFQFLYHYHHCGLLWSTSCPPSPQWLCPTYMHLRKNNSFTMQYPVLVHGGVYAPYMSGMLFGVSGLLFFIIICLAGWHTYTYIKRGSGMHNLLGPSVLCLCLCCSEYCLPWHACRLPPADPGAAAAQCRAAQQTTGGLRPCCPCTSCLQP